MRAPALGLMLFLGGCFGGWSRFVPSESDGFGLRSATLSGAPRSYYAYVPKAAPPAGGWPVILFLHGGGEGGDVSVRPTQVGLGPIVQRSHGTFPFVVIFPQSSRRSSWTARRTEAHALAVLDESLGALPVDPKRVYVVGNSMGGHGALLIASRHPERFAALVAVAGRAGRSSWFPTPPDAVEDLPRDDPYGALAASLARVPAWLVHGEEDGITPADESRKLAAALSARGAEVRLTIYPGAGHAGSWERAYEDPAIFAWLAQHRLP